MGMDFSGNLAAIQQRLARSADMASRRAHVLEALGAAPGERIAELGCGGGLLLREIGLAVGESGLAFGIDLSEEQARAARELCADVKPVEVRAADLRAIPAPEATFDAVVSTQVIEYVEGLAAALAEIARVTRPGSRFVNVATNWGSLFWSGGDEAATARILAAWQRHAPHPNLPVALPALLEAAGFSAVSQRPLTIVNRHIQPSTFAHGAARLMAAFALAQGDVERAAADAWLASLERADAEGRHFLSVVPVLTTATRI
jgi:ubiquinone/menaquinone biosynthesis C-methylase UbiE